MYTEGAGPICKCTGQCTVEGSVQGGGYILEMQNLTAAKFPEASFPTANLFTANFPRTNVNSVERNLQLTTRPMMTACYLSW